MRNYTVLRMILQEAIKELTENLNLTKAFKNNLKCNAFLCPKDGTCRTFDTTTQTLQQHHYYEIVVSVTHVFLNSGSIEDLSEILLPAITKDSTWAQCLDRHHVCLLSLLYYLILWIE